ncbi:unnamed protein product [Clavelina lepadiformis]|uniref:Uncharacterized protein n=1 Tax=Clavelina lepadiformis TaxID=159417 RepID=A0ABP0FV00_CLALP
MRHNTSHDSNLKEQDREYKPSGLDVHWLGVFYSGQKAEFCGMTIFTVGLKKVFAPLKPDDGSSSLEPRLLIAMSCRLVDRKPDLVQARIETFNPEFHCSSPHCKGNQNLRSDAYHTTDIQFNLHRLSIGQARNSCESKTPQPQTKNVELESRCSAKLSYGSRISKWILSELVIGMVRECGAIL